MFLIPIHSLPFLFFFFFNDTATTEIYTLSLHDALPISGRRRVHPEGRRADDDGVLTRAAEGAREEIDGFVTAARGEECLGRTTVERSEALDESARLRLGIAVESVLRVIAGCAPGELVGVQAREPRLPRGVAVGLERHDVRPRPRCDPAQEVTSVSVADGSPTAPAARDSRRRVTASAWPSRPSRPASVAAVGPSERSPARVSSCTVMTFRKSRTQSPLEERA